MPQTIRRRRKLARHHVAVRLRAARASRGVTRDEAAGYAGVHRANVELIECEYCLPTLAVLWRLCSLYEVSPADVTRGLRGGV